jgi:hypothetical protein
VFICDVNVNVRYNPFISDKVKKKYEYWKQMKLMKNDMSNCYIDFVLSAQKDTKCLLYSSNLTKCGIVSVFLDTSVLHIFCMLLNDIITSGRPKDLNYLKNIQIVVN